MNSTKFRLITNQKPYEIDPVLRLKCIKNTVTNTFKTPIKYDKNHVTGFEFSRTY